MVRRATTTPAQLVECAFNLFAERGINNVNMEEIASAASVTKGSLYWHFNSKKQVIEGACKHYYRTWQSNIQRSIAQESDALRRLELTLRQSVRSCLLDEKNRIFTMEILTMSLYDEDVRKS